MGYLLKEALKTLCDVNQWTYAVFWKIGHQNPKLLIWEECYYEPMTFSLPPEVSGSGTSEAPSGGWEAKDRVQMLIERMMTKAQINVVGEGIIGRAAFTGDHEWIVSTSYGGHAHPPEVVKEVHHQFSAGIQTVAVIPVPLHGVLQLGSSIAIMEHMGFVNDVRSLILQVACIPGALFSRTSAGKAEMLGYPGMLTADPPGNCQAIGSESLMTNSYKDTSSFSYPSGLGGRSSALITNTVDNLQTAASTLLALEKASSLAEFCSHPSKPCCAMLMKTGLSPRGEVDSGLPRAEVIPVNFDAWLNQHAVACNLGNDKRGQTALGPTHGTCSIFEPVKKNMSAGVVPEKPDNKWTCFLNSTVTAQPGRNGCSIGDPCKTSDASQLLHEVTHPPRSISVACSLSESVSRNLVGNASFHDGNFAKLEGIPLYNLSEQFLSGASGQRNHLMSMKRAQTELPSKKQRMVGNFSQQVMPPNYSHASLIEQKPGWARASEKVEGGSQKMRSTCNAYENASVQQLVRNDLFDILGADMTNNIIDGNLESLLADEPHFDARKSGAEASSVVNVLEAQTDLGSLSEVVSESGIFSTTAVDNLLDAVVSGTRPTSIPSSDDNVSCKTSVTRISSSSVPSSSSLNNNFNVLNQEHKDSFGIQKSFVKAGVSNSGSLKSGCSKNGVEETCSLSNSFYGSHLSSWVDQGHSVRQDNHASTGHSKRQDGMIKSNRKRLKPGENPRPRPKDRQLIQDRVKELREIVPNGAKCSIDALLERTIKHMLFLQSVSKHADKLKQIGGSKIINEDGIFLLKDNFERGTTWAYEIGSQSMVHPIIVEDLNPPRQMIVEMLCEERGFFLEIADMIRGLGLTILKGVMETHNDRIWARFAVEADRDVTRVEIFMSLVRLLEETMESSPSAANAADGKTPMVCQPFAQAASIPVTGGHNVLQ